MPDDHRSHTAHPPGGTAACGWEERQQVALGSLARAGAAVRGDVGDVGAGSLIRMTVRLVAAVDDVLVAPGQHRAAGTTTDAVEPVAPSRARSTASASPVRSAAAPTAEKPAPTEHMSDVPAEPYDTPVAAVHFYSFDEVELPAAPVSDWELDAATLDSARIERLVFDVFVNDEGTVVGCAIVEPSDIDAELRASLEARLRTTVLLPAMRTQKAVASVRRIEFKVS